MCRMIWKYLRCNQKIFEIKEPMPYKWTYKMDTSDLSQEDIDSIVYEVVNAKAASAENKTKTSSCTCFNANSNT